MQQRSALVPVNLDNIWTNIAREQTLCKRLSMAKDSTGSMLLRILLAAAAPAVHQTPHLFVLILWQLRLLLLLSRHKLHGTP